MNDIAQQIIHPVACDPDRVVETCANGPINVQGFGSICTLTFTAVRPKDVGALMKGAATDYSAVVVSRLVLPVENAIELRNLLNRTFADKPQAGMFLKQ